MLCADTRVVDAAHPLRPPDTVLARYAFAARDDDAAALLAAAGVLAEALRVAAAAGVPFAAVAEALVP